MLRFQGWGIPLSTLRNGIFWNRTSDDGRHGEKFFSLRALCEGGWEKQSSSQGAEVKMNSQDDFLPPKSWFNRVFRGLNVFLSTTQPILSPFVIWTLLLLFADICIMHSRLQIPDFPVSDLTSIFNISTKIFNISAGQIFCLLLQQPCRNITWEGLWLQFIIKRKSRISKVLWGKVL